jgi:hypothetical protein
MRYSRDYLDRSLPWLTAPFFGLGTPSAGS